MTDSLAAPHRRHITVGPIRATDIQSGDVIALPSQIYLPASDEEQRWTWIQNTPDRLPQQHPWRWVYESGDIGGEPSYTRDLPYGFVVVRVSDDRSDQGRQRHSIVLALHAFDLVTARASNDLDSPPPSQP